MAQLTLGKSAKLLILNMAKAHRRGLMGLDTLANGAMARLKVKEFSTMRMVMFLKEVSHWIKRMDSEFTSTKVGRDTKVTGLMTCKMDLVKRF
jgi:hypothetical protein